MRTFDTSRVVHVNIILGHAKKETGYSTAARWKKLPRFALVQDRPELLKYAQVVHYLRGIYVT